jgi:peptidoglycan/LPS O-acetylase OafA/YrhL
VTGLANGAVIVFFVLSGFLVGGKAIKGWTSGQFAWRRYLVDRTVRLWIVLLPALALTLIADTVGRSLFSDSAKYGAGGEIAQHSSAVDFVGNVFFLQSNLVPPFGSNGALWSLAYEYGYYLMFPVILVGILGRRRHILSRLAFLGVMAALIVIFGQFVMLFFGMWLLGAFIAWLAPLTLPLVRRMSPGWLSAARALGVLAALGGMGLDSLLEGQPRHLTAGGVATGIFTAILLVLLADDWKPRSRAMLWVRGRVSGYGNVTYSLYAAHVPVLMLLAVAVSPSHSIGSFAPGPLGWALVLVATAAMILLGWAFGQLTEVHTGSVRAVAYRLFRVKRAQPAADLNSPV